MRLKALQELAAGRDEAFLRLCEAEFDRIRSKAPSSAALPQFWTWKADSILEMQQIREVEQLRKERFAKEKGTFTPGTDLSLRRPPWFWRGTEKTAWSPGLPPGKRFSVQDMPQVHYKPQQYRWIQESTRLRSTCLPIFTHHTDGSRADADVANHIWATLYRTKP